jgi:hypothetical protein
MISGVKWSALCLVPLVLLSACGGPALSSDRPTPQDVAAYTQAVTGEAPGAVPPETADRLVRLGDEYCTALNSALRNHLPSNTNAVLSQMDLNARDTGLALTLSVPARSFLCRKVGKAAAQIAVEEANRAGSRAAVAARTAAKLSNLAFTRVALGPQGLARSAISGTTRGGQRVTGYFTPSGVTEHNGHLRIKGMVTGVIHRSNGHNRTFSSIRNPEVASINGSALQAAPAGHAAAVARCGILHLALSPLNLDFSGLRVRLDQVVLAIVAQPGSGHLLQTQLCDVVRLVDGGKAASPVRAQLNAILATLLVRP